MLQTSIVQLLDSKKLPHTQRWWLCSYYCTSSWPMMLFQKWHVRCNITAPRMCMQVVHSSVSSNSCTCCTLGACMSCMPCHAHACMHSCQQRPTDTELLSTAPGALVLFMFAVLASPLVFPVRWLLGPTVSISSLGCGVCVFRSPVGWLFCPFL